MISIINEVTEKFIAFILIMVQQDQLKKQLICQPSEQAFEFIVAIKDLFNNIVCSVVQQCLKKVQHEYECAFCCDVLSSLASNTSDLTPASTARPINFNATDVALREFENLGCDSCAALTAPPTVTIIVIDDENKLEYSGGLNGLHTQSHQ